MGLMSRLVLGSNHFAQQYVQVGGLQPSVLRELLGANRSAATLTDGLLILCQLARTSGSSEQAAVEPRALTSLYVTLPYRLASSYLTEPTSSCLTLPHLFFTQGYAGLRSFALCERLPPLLQLRPYFTKYGMTEQRSAVPVLYRYYSR